MKETVRLDRLLSTHGFGTRKEVKKLLHARAVTVNGAVITSPEMHIDMQNDAICVDGEALTLSTHVYLMMNKPQNVVCSNKDGEHTTVFDLLDDEYRNRFLGGGLHCIGRLDIDTEGLLLLTTDGALTHRLTSPKTHKAKTYAVTLAEPVSKQKQAEYTASFLRGLFVPEEHNEASFTAQSAVLEWLPEKTNKSTIKGLAPDAVQTADHAEKTSTDDSLQNAPNAVQTAPDKVLTAQQKELTPDTHAEEYTTKCILTIYEGKYHQVKRMFAAVGNKVTHLKRIRMGDLALDSALLPGSYRVLSKEELALL